MAPWDAEATTNDDLIDQIKEKVMREDGWSADVVEKIGEAMRKVRAHTHTIHSAS